MWDIALSKITINSTSTVALPLSIKYLCNHLGFFIATF